MKNDLLWIDEHRKKESVGLPTPAPFQFLFRTAFVWKEKFIDLVTRTDRQYTTKSNEITVPSQKMPWTVMFLGTCDRYEQSIDAIEVYMNIVYCFYSTYLAMKKYLLLSPTFLREIWKNNMCMFVCKLLLHAGEGQPLTRVCVFVQTIVAVSICQQASTNMN